MALTPEQQSQIDFSRELEVQRFGHEINLESQRQNNMLLMDKRRAKLEAVRMAKEILVENRRNLPTEQREITAADITTFADTIINYVDT